MFTAREDGGGIVLACLKCRTYIGIPARRDQLTYWSGSRDIERKHAGRPRRFRLLGWLLP